VTIFNNKKELEIWVTFCAFRSGIIDIYEILKAGQIDNK
jgi:hypothetical protein